MYDYPTRVVVRPFRILNKFYHLYFKRIIDFNRETTFSDQEFPIDVVVTLAKKDFGVLPYSIKGIVDNVKHKIENIVIVSETYPEIEDFCKKGGYKLVDENQVLPIKKSDIDYK